MDQPPEAPAPEQADPDQQAGVQRYNDEFMMFVFKVEMCKRVDKHDREKCPYAHPGELARRRHPSLYQALPCPEARAKKICPRLENCNCSHSTFEFWLHPDRYKTFLCERGANCSRPICFFAHSEQELRELPKGLQRTKQTHKTSTSSASSSAGGAGSSHQAQLAASGAGQACHSQAPGGLIYVPASAGQGYVTMPQGVGYTPQMQQGSEPGPLMMSYVPMQQQQQQQAGLQQYVAVPVQQGRSSDAGLAGAAAMGGPQSPSMQLMQQQLVYAPAAAAGEEVVGQAGPGGPLQMQISNQQRGYAGMQYAPQMLAAPGMYPQVSAQQMMVGYQPAAMGVQDYAAPSGGLMVRPGPQRGATVAVIPAGPSAWSNSVVTADASEAPSLEALCAAMSQMAVPTAAPAGVATASPPDVLLQQYPQQGRQQQPQLQQPPPQQQLSVYSAPAPPQQQQQQQVPMLGSQQSQQQQQLLPGQQVVVVVTPEEAPQVGWSNMPPGV